MRGAERCTDARLSAHPLFLLLGVFSAFTGRLLLFVLATLAAVEHECAHAFAARRYGFTLDRIVLMPYGAVISGDLSGMTGKQEIAVALAGPLANGVTALFFVALWWLFPETYPYTDAAAYISFSLFLVNLLPAYPLDGGRILAVLLRPLGEKRARIVRTAVSLLTAAGAVALFVLSCFTAPRFETLAFGLLLVAGCFGGGSYRRVVFSRAKSFARGVEEMRVAISADVPAGNALRFLREDRYLVFILFSGEEFLAELTEEEFLRGAQKSGYDLPLRALISSEIA